MGLARSTFYDRPAPSPPGDLLGRIGAICDEFKCYGYRRGGAALRHQGVVVNGKKLRRLMREHGLQPKRRRRYVVTTNSGHAGPIFPDLAKDIAPERPSQLWVADLTYVAIPGGFVYLAAILGCLVAQGGGLRDQPVDGRPHRCRGAEGCHTVACASSGLHPPLRPWVAICV